MSKNSNGARIKVSINGFGRIGRAFLKVAWERPEIEIVAVNDLGSVENMAYLLKYDTVYGKWSHPVRAISNGTGENYIEIGGKKIKVLAEKEPSRLPWKNLGVDVVVESTGLFASYDKAKAHLDAGAKKLLFLPQRKILRKPCFRQLAEARLPFLARLFYLG